MIDPVLEPLKPLESKKLARGIVLSGAISFSIHAMEEMAKDDLQSTDCLNLLRGGVFGPAEYINREWRYRVETPRICIVVAFISDRELRIVTAWRIKQ